MILINNPRNITRTIVKAGIVLCLLASIWDEDKAKWVLTSLYLFLVSKYFGLNYRNDSVKGMPIRSPYKELNFLNLRNK